MDSLGHRRSSPTAGTPGPEWTPDLPLATPPPSFEELFLPLVDNAFRLAMSLVRDTSEAEDLVQEAALAAYRGFASFTPGTNFKAWFYRILVNRHYYHHRRNRGRPVAVELEDAPELYLFARTAEIGLHRGDEDPAEALMRKMTSDQVRRAIASLPEDYRVPVGLFFLEELSYQAIASVVDCPVGTVRSRLHRGRRMLQKALWKIAEEAGIVRQLAAREAPA